MTREEIILAHIKRDGLGLEIGAGCSPIAPKKQGFRVHVLDHCDKEALIEKYRPHGIAVENIEEVDFVWDGRPYGELIGRRHVYDWIIASHVLEHTTDLIGFLNDCDSLLKEGGVLSLAVPDKRYSFDHFRRTFEAARWLVTVAGHSCGAGAHASGAHDERGHDRRHDPDGAGAWRGRRPDGPTGPGRHRRPARLDGGDAAVPAGGLCRLHGRGRHPVPR